MAKEASLKIHIFILYVALENVKGNKQKVLQKFQLHSAVGSLLKSMYICIWKLVEFSLTGFEKDDGIDWFDILKAEFLFWILILSTYPFILPQEQV